MAKKQPAQRAAASDPLAALGSVTADLDPNGFRPSGEVLLRVKAVQTRFPSIDRATRVGGWPIQRVTMIHGESSHGKTTLMIGLGDSFLQRNHFFALVDAEHTTPQPWLDQLMGPRSHHPGFVAMRPRSFDATVAGVRDLVTKVSAAREAGNIAPDTSCLIGIDSIRKLVPEKLLEKIAAEEGGIDGAKGRAAMMKAALNAQWLDELVPLMYHTNSGIVFITREIDNPEGGPWSPDHKVTGGRSLLFDSSIAARVSRASWIKHDDQVIGEHHRVRIYKTKVAGKDDKVVDAFFNTSNGTWVAAGFDRARDVLEMAIELEILTKSPVDHQKTGERFGRGLDAAVKTLTERPESLDALEQEVRATFEAVA